MSAGATASDSPLIQGRNARVNGQARDTCPHPAGSEERAVWMQAWDEAGVGENDGGLQDKSDLANI